MDEKGKDDGRNKKDEGREQRMRMKRGRKIIGGIGESEWREPKDLENWGDGKLSKG